MAYADSYEEEEEEEAKPNIEVTPTTPMVTSEASPTSNLVSFHQKMVYHLNSSIDSHYLLISKPQ
ncbi:hypothetical protein PVK06_029680 [Gossypium arboreum]|uniref:Uncharacterized protein n=1 Tax=Gossypium arboreum TaxID=29729 RepID=A0ABR0NL66_GOSAR|nr:hypothetical protein PVK06_029680 [Gossypium arboreum]